METGILVDKPEAPKREISAGTKLTFDENKELEALASDRHLTPSEFLRALIREEAERISKISGPSPEMIEIVGLRLMLTNFLRPLAHGKMQTKEEVEVLMNTIRVRKKPLAQEIIDGTKE